MIEEATLQDLYDSGIKFDVCCSANGGFRVRLGTPATGFRAAVVVDTYAAVVQQLAQWSSDISRGQLRAKVRIRQSPSRMPEATTD